MKKTAYQVPELRDENNNIIQNGAFGRKTAFVTADNQGVLDYIMNDLEALKDMQIDFSDTVAKQIGEKVNKSGDTITGPILYDKTPNDGAELINKAYVDSAIKSMVSERDKAIGNMHTTITGERNKAIDDLHSAITKEIANAILQTKKDLYPVGAIFISLTDSRNPAEILGFGTWEALPAGYGLVAQGTATAEDGTTLTFTAGEKTGEFKHKLSKGEIANHTHRIALAKGGYPNTEPQSILFLPGSSNQNINGTFSDRKVSGTYADGNSGYYVDSEFIESTCVASYIWRRTA